MNIATFRESAASGLHSSFPPPSFLQGMGSVLDLFGVLDANIQYSEGIEDDIDVKAVFDDFIAVGLDLADAISWYESEQEPHTPEATPTA